MLKRFFFCQTKLYDFQAPSMLIGMFSFFPNKHKDRKFFITNANLYLERF